VPAERIISHVRNRCVCYFRILGVLHGLTIIVSVELTLLGRVMKLGLLLDVLLEAHATVLCDSKVVADGFQLATQTPGPCINAAIPILGRSKTVAERRVQAVTSRIRLAFESLSEAATLLMQHMAMNQSLAKELQDTGDAGHAQLVNAKANLSQMQHDLLNTISQILLCKLP